MSAQLAFEVRSTASRDEAVGIVTDALDVEGFVVVTKIEIDQIFREEIGATYRPYTILGVCDPRLTHATLTKAPHLGLMFPFNVTVEADINGSLTRILNPETLTQTGNLAGDYTIQRVAKAAGQRLHRVANALRAISDENPALA